jgi:heme oxygenase
MHQSLLPISGPLLEYIQHLQELSEAVDPSPLLAHAYVRYLGDLSGGQVIRRRVAKAYGLEADGGSGLRFYDFKELSGSKPANIGGMKRIKEWFRDGMNAGAGDNNRKLKGISHLLTSLTSATDPAIQSRYLTRSKRGV